MYRNTKQHAFYTSVFISRLMAIGWCLCVCDGGRAWTPHLSSLSFLYIRKTFLMRLLYCFCNKLGKFQGSTDTQCHKRTLKHQMLWILCGNIVSGLSWNSKKSMVLVQYLLPIVWKKYLLTKNIWFYKTIFSSRTPMLSLKLSLMIV